MVKLILQHDSNNRFKVNRFHNNAHYRDQAAFRFVRSYEDFNLEHPHFGCTVTNLDCNLILRGDLEVVLDAKLLRLKYTSADFLRCGAVHRQRRWDDVWRPGEVSTL